MDRKMKAVVLALVLVLLIAAAIFAYNLFGKELLLQGNNAVGMGGGKMPERTGGS